MTGIKEPLRRLSEAISLPTVSGGGGEAFLRFHSFIKRSYPAVWAAGETVVVDDYALMLKIKGGGAPPIALLGHMDVVPPGPGWTREPFSGEIEGGFIYGRGAFDMKGQLIAALEAINALLASGLAFPFDIYLCMGCDEEKASNTAALHMAQEIEQRGARPAFVVDEGGGVMRGAPFGLERDIAVIGVCEKGYADIKLVSHAKGGHSSAPPEHTALGTLFASAAALDKRESASISPPLAAFLKAVCEISGKTEHETVALMEKDDAAASLLRTTYALTMARGSDAPNVLPQSAYAVVNARIRQGSSVKEACERVKERCPGVLAELMFGNEPTDVSSVDSAGYLAVKSALKDVFPGHVVAPCPVSLGTDSRHFYKVCGDVYRVTPYLSYLQDVGRMHGADERLSVKSFESAILFYKRLLIRAGELFKARPR